MFYKYWVTPMYCQDVMMVIGHTRGFIGQIYILQTFDNYVQKIVMNKNEDKIDIMEIVLVYSIS
jgi:hypothetical protein